MEFLESFVLFWDWDTGITGNLVRLGFHGACEQIDHFLSGRIFFGVHTWFGRKGMVLTAE